MSDPRQPDPLRSPAPPTTGWNPYPQSGPPTQEHRTPEQVPGYPPPDQPGSGYPQPYPPTGYGPGYPPAGYPPAGYGPAGYGRPYAYAPAPPTNSLAIASMIIAILGLGPVGAIMGHVARRQIQERGEQGDGFALAGIIVGWVTTGIWVLVCGVYALIIAGFFAANIGST